ncbi:MAG TPA: helix-turn-helix domain-containing protein [Solirubrobacteraceae bacterium]|nr:helix-turn-helix domain-containing protein [Solirubrobacteraceae bacterium]
MLNRAYPSQDCSIARALEVVGERWTLLILRDAILGLDRFDDFQRSLGIATNVLTNRLRLLADEGLLERVPDPQRADRHRYVLTDKGRALGPAIISLMKWGDRFYAGPEGPPRLTLHRGCGGTLDDALVCDRCGQRAASGEIDLPAREEAAAAHAAV